MVNRPTDAGERAEEIRDLRNQIAELKTEDQREIVFQDLSRRPPKVPIWNTQTGREVRIPQHLLEQTLKKRDQQTGEYLFTSRKSRAPEYQPGTIRCFMHADGEERELLDAIGLANMTCRKSNLVSEYSKRMHAEHRHAAAWALYREAVEKQEKEADRAAQRQQTDAMLAMAGNAAAGKKAKGDA